MEILLTNVDQDPIEIEFDDWNLSRYRDAHRASEFKITCARRIPVKRYARVIATEGGKVLFRGYVRSPRIKNIDTRELNCKGEEDLLLRRTTGRFSFSPNTRALVHAFQSDAPPQVADAYGIIKNVGLIWQANSMIPFHGKVITAGEPYFDWFYHGHNYIYQLVGLGTTSRLGLTPTIYSEGTLLPRVADFATLETTALSSWSDADGLWVRCDDTVLSHGFGPRKLLCAHNAYDTGVRMGNIAALDTYLTGNFQTDFDRILDILIDLAEFYGTVPHFRYERDYTYFDTLLGVPENEFYLPEEYLKDINQSIASDQRVHALIGKGIGSRDVQQIYTKSDHQWKGVWVEETFDVADGCLGDGGILKNTLDAEYARLNADDLCSVTPTTEWANQPETGDMIRLALDGETEKLLQVASLKTSCKALPEYELGARRKDIIDRFNAKSSLSRVYTEEFLKQSSIPVTGSGNLITGDLTHGWCTGYEGSFLVKADAESADDRHRVFLDISMSADVEPEPMLVKILINDLGNQFTQFGHYMIGDSISKIDITDIVLYGESSTIKVYCKRMTDWPTHANCGDHPVASISYTVTCYNGTVDATAPIPIEGEGQYILHPVSDHLKQIHYPSGAHWSLVDDEVSDENTTVIYMKNGQGLHYDIFNLGALDEASEIGVITSVRVCFRCRRSANECGGQAYAYIEFEDQIDQGARKTLSPGWSTFSEEWVENPFTNDAWTWLDIRALKAGVGLSCSLYTGLASSYCTQLYVLVKFT